MNGACWNMQLEQWALLESVFALSLRLFLPRILDQNHIAVCLLMALMHQRADYNLCSGIMEKT